MTRALHQESYDYDEGRPHNRILSIALTIVWSCVRSSMSLASRLSPFTAAGGMGGRFELHHLPERRHDARPAPRII